MCYLSSVSLIRRCFNLGPANRNKKVKRRLDWLELLVIWCFGLPTKLGRSARRLEEFPDELVEAKVFNPENTSSFSMFVALFLSIAQLKGLCLTWTYTFKSRAFLTSYHTNLPNNFAKIYDTAVIYCSIFARFLQELISFSASKALRRKEFSPAASVWREQR